MSNSSTNLALEPADFKMPNDLDTRVTRLHMDALIGAAEKVLEGRSLTKNNIVRVAFALMHVGEKMTGVKGKVKKEALLAALDVMVQRDKGLGQEEKDMLSIMINDVVSRVVDDKFVDDQNSVPVRSCCVIV